MLRSLSDSTSPYFKSLSSSFERMDGILQRHLSKLYRRESRERLGDKEHQSHLERIIVDGDVLSYASDELDRVGVYVAADAIRPDRNYFEVEILDFGITGNIVIGLVPVVRRMDQQPGWTSGSVGYHAADGRLYKGCRKGTAFGPKCQTGDKIGCGVKFEQKSKIDNQRTAVTVFFTRNGKEVGTSTIILPPGGLFPAIGLHSQGEEVRLRTDVKWNGDEETLMCIDSNEDDWLRLHDIRLNGSVLEYAGRGKSIIDVGLAQARYPLDTTSHYFEIEIVDPGENCYIAIGLARRDYPKHRHPGWNKGSIAYHADDGKIFIGSGVGDPFGPQCLKGDVMGCGILFPRDYVCNYDSDSSQEPTPSSNSDGEDGFGRFLSESEDEEWWKEVDKVEGGAMVQVFFTRNGKTIGSKEVCIPKGGFYPTVGMLSNDEKVKVDLHPLTG